MVQLELLFDIFAIESAVAWGFDRFVDCIGFDWLVFIGFLIAEIEIEPDTVLVEIIAGTELIEKLADTVMVEMVADTESIEPLADTELVEREADIEWAEKVVE